MTAEEAIKENEKYFRNLNEMAEQSCLNKLNSGMDCQQNCTYYRTIKCRHPEKVFNGTQIRY